MKCNLCNKEFVGCRQQRERSKQGVNVYCSKKCLYKSFSSRMKRNNPMFGKRKMLHHNWKGGKPKCIDCGKQLKGFYAKRCKSCSTRGDKSYLWKGGITKFASLLRKSFEYRLWRDDVFTRDNYTCQICGRRSGNGERVFLHAHHIKKFSDILSEYNIKTRNDAISCQQLWNINNGITYCKKCHFIEHKC